MAQLLTRDGDSLQFYGPFNEVGRGLTLLRNRVNLDNYVGSKISAGDYISCFVAPNGSYILAMSVNVITPAISTAGTLRISNAAGTKDYHTIANPDVAGFAFCTGADLPDATGSVGGLGISLWVGTGTVYGGVYEITALVAIMGARN